MSEFKSMLERIDFKNLLSEVMYGSDSIYDEEFDSYKEKLENAFTVLFDKLRKIYPSASPDDDDLFDALVGFALIHNEVYFEMGAIVGFQLYKNFENRLQKCDMKEIALLINEMAGKEG